MEGIGEKALVYGLLLKSTVSLFFCVFGVDCNYTDNLESRFWDGKWVKKGVYYLKILVKSDVLNVSHQLLINKISSFKNLLIAVLHYAFILNY